MRWLKVAAVLVGVVIAFLIVSSVVGFLIEAVVAVLVVAVVVLAVKMAVNRRQVSGQRRDRLGGLRQTRPLRRKTPDVEEDMTRLKREMGG